jgi:hypothetical protein
MSADYGDNVGRFKADHPGVVLLAGRGGFGYTAQQGDDRGRGAGPKVTALTLDELHTLLERAEGAKGV